jgi:iron complex transport system permease protein
MGAAILGGADLLARALIAPLELPVGVLTSILGGGYMLILMRRLSKGDRSS